MSQSNNITDSKNIKLGMLLSYAGMGVSIIGALFISNRVLNYIGDYNYGLYSFVTSITAWLTIISSALNASFLRFTTIEAKKNGNVGTTNTIYLKILTIVGIVLLIIGLGVIGILYGCHINIGKYNWDDSQMMYLLFALSVLNISLTMPTHFFSLFVSYKKKFIFARLLTIVISIWNFAGHFLIAYFTKNVILIAGFAILSTVVTFVVNSIYCYKKLQVSFTKTSLRNNSFLVRSIFIFSGILIFNTIVDQVNTNVDKTLLGFFSIPENVTRYQMAQQLAHYLTTMSIAVSGVFAPTIHEYVANNDQEALNKLYLKISKIQTIILCCVAFGFLACGKDFILWWLGESRIASYYVGATLMILSLGPLTMNASIEIQRAKNKHKFRAITYFGLAIANVGLSILFLHVFEPQYSIFACLSGTVITTICSHWIAMNIYNKKEIKLPVGKYLTTLFLYMTVGIAGFFAVFLFNKLFISNLTLALFRFIIQGSIFVIFYLSICFIFNRKKAIQYLKKISRSK